MARRFTLAEIENFLNSADLKTELKGDGECSITGLQSLIDAGAGELSFLSDKSFAKYLEDCRASAVILQPAMADRFHGNKLITANPYAAYARVSALFDPLPKAAAGIHPSAVVAETAEVDPSASIGPAAVIGDQAVIGASTSIAAGCFVGDRSVIGANSNIAANVSIYHDVVIGDRATIHSNSVIGADGFGFANDQGRWIKIHQLGGVTIGDDVEIGACSTVDRGALGDTVLENGVIIDNHVQIAHNVRVGENTAMAAFVGISGSTRIGKNCTFAGQAGVVGHIDICDGVHITGRTVVSKSITEPGSYSSGTRISKTSLWRKNAARFNQLEEMAQRLKTLEKKLGGPK